MLLINAHLYMSESKQFEITYMQWKFLNIDPLQISHIQFSRHKSVHNSKASFHMICILTISRWCSCSSTIKKKKIRNQCDLSTDVTGIVYVGWSWHLCTDSREIMVPWQHISRASSQAGRHWSFYIRHAVTTDTKMDDKSRRGRGFSGTSVWSFEMKYSIQGKCIDTLALWANETDSSGLWCSTKLNFIGNRTEHSFFHVCIRMYRRDLHLICVYRALVLLTDCTT